MNSKPAYNFSSDIKNYLKGFKSYLQKLGQDKSTIRQKMNYAGYFLMLLKTQPLSPEATCYDDLLDFIDYS